MPANADADAATTATMAYIANCKVVPPRLSPGFGTFAHLCDRRVRGLRERARSDGVNDGAAVIDRQSLQVTTPIV